MTVQNMASPAVRDLDQLLDWCSSRAPGRIARTKRVPVLFNEFRDLLDGKWHIVTVTGTSGKGSTCAILEAMLAQSGHVTGVFTSPHLVSVAERCRISGAEVSLDQLSRHVRKIFPRLDAFVRATGLEYRPSFFESLILVAFSLFAETGVTAVILEAAIGGANDAVACLPADSSIVTAVGLDHCEELGDTIEAIAREKAGIAPPGGHLIVGAGVCSVAREAILAESWRRTVSCTIARTDELRAISADMTGQTVELHRGSQSILIRLPWPGEHQIENLAAALACAEAIAPSGATAALYRGLPLMRPHLPGRFEFVAGSPSWLLDVAHNPLSIAALIDTLRTLCPRAEIIPVVGGTDPHDYGTMIRLISAAYGRVAVCGGFVRAADTQRLLAEVPDECEMIGVYESPREGIDALLSTGRHANSIVVVTGSLFMVGMWREELRRLGALGAR